MAAGMPFKRVDLFLHEAVDDEFRTYLSSGSIFG
jgi:hypothetical protein